MQWPTNSALLQVLWQTSFAGKIGVAAIWAGNFALNFHGNDALLGQVNAWKCETKVAGSLGG